MTRNIPHTIDYEHMFAAMLRACPSFEPQWSLFVQEWTENAILDERVLDDLEPDRRLPLYLALAELARHLIHLLENEKTDPLPSVFAVVECWHLDGTHEVKEAATVGLLEDLQNTNLYTSAQPDDFIPWLGPEAKRWWRKVERFWSHGEIITDD